MSASGEGAHAFQVDDWLVIVREVEGLGRVVSAVQLPPPGSSPTVIEGVRRRLLIATTGRCPCGATVVPPSREVSEQAVADGGFPEFDVIHADDCPAGRKVMRPALDRDERRARKRGGL